MSADPKSRDSYRAWTGNNIRYSDLDPNGHANNGAINAFFEDGRVRFRDEHLDAVVADTLSGFVIVRFSVEYHAPLFYPGNVDIGTSIGHIGRTSYRLRQALFEGERCAASSESVTVAVDAESGRPRPIPDTWRTVLARFVVEFE